MSYNQSFLSHPPVLSGSNQQTLGSEAGETWREMAANFSYEVSIFITVAVL
jgi:hypothetical protein